LRFGKGSEDDFGPGDALRSTDTDPGLAVPGREVVENQAKAGLAKIEDQGLMVNELAWCSGAVPIPGFGRSHVVAVSRRRVPSLEKNAGLPWQAGCWLNLGGNVLGIRRPADEDLDPVDIVPK
jgi:hypothetical protein